MKRITMSQRWELYDLTYKPETTEDERKRWAYLMCLKIKSDQRVKENSIDREAICSNVADRDCTHTFVRVGRFTPDPSGLLATYFSKFLPVK